MGPVRGGGRLFRAGPDRARGSGRIGSSRMGQAVSAGLRCIRPFLRHPGGGSRVFSDPLEKGAV